MVCAWCVHGAWMVCARCVDGVHMVRERCVDGVCTVRATLLQASCSTIFFQSSSGLTSWKPKSGSPSSSAAAEA
eukprot:1000666-Prymnesium_polylepis.2